MSDASHHDPAPPSAVLCADVGGTSAKLGAFVGDTLVRRQELSVHDRTRLAPLLDQIAAAWRAMVEGMGSGFAPRSLALALPGVVDGRAGRVRTINDKYADPVDLPDWAGATFGLPMQVENDARAAAVGEWRAGAGDGCDDLVMMTLGTGIGAGVILQGRPFYGAHAQGGILGGHLTLDLSGPECPCGNRGCGEALASTAALQRAGGTNYRDVVARARAGDAAALATWQQSLRVWGAAALNLVQAFDPARLVVGGGIAAGAPEVVDAVRRHVMRYATPTSPPTDVVPARLGNDAALYGLNYLSNGGGAA